MKQIIAFVTILVSIVLLVPAAMVAFGDNDKEMADASFGLAYLEKTSEAEETKVQSESVTTEEKKEAIDIPVYRAKKETIEHVPITDYIIGVVASEMPTTYEGEALKAQALAARTYLLSQQLKSQEDRNVSEGALIEDTVKHQVFQSKDELKEIWKDKFEERWNKVEAAVIETEGEIMTYNEQPITASFFSTSNGFTENAEDFWTQEIPYLKSVASPWDKESPRYANEVTIPVETFEDALDVKLPGDGSIGKIIARTDGERVGSVEISGKTFSGREIREALDLDSSDFTWHLSNGNVVIQTKGWGHGVGMSQFGANGMAKEGKSYREIVKHYYQGITIESMESIE
ncbi:stage II sporulation protein D [Shouchella patagoniensis]|uniref:stage II sporulation protein D n=1 Tax=Shouchella patagoniensis TaxID=228576 RepID=UPI000994D0C6|nr:stage II sporulation protein D [Shouchella patagoniensis]